MVDFFGIISILFKVTQNTRSFLGVSFLMPDQLKLGIKGVEFIPILFEVAENIRSFLGVSFLMPSQLKLDTWLTMPKSKPE